MQRCPKCNRTYQDDTQKFCTFDGGRLMVDAEAPTTFDLSNAPTSVDPLGATVTGPDPDLNKTVAGVQPPLTSEIQPPAPTGPTDKSTPVWSDAPPAANMQPQTSTGTTGPTTTAPIATPPPPAAASAPPSQSGAVSMPPASTSPQLPPTAPVARQPAATAPVQSPPVAHPQQPTAPMAATPPVATPSGQSATAPPRKSSKVLLIVGLLALLFLLLIGGGAAFYFIGMKPRLSANTQGSGSSIETSPGTSKNANTAEANKPATTSSQPPVEAPPNATKFTNSRDKLSGSLSEHFVGFSLYYPNSWTVDPKAGTTESSNFFKADRTLSDSTGDYLLERLAVSWYQSNGTVQLDRPIFPNRVEYFNNLFSKDYPDYQKVSEGETKFNDMDGYQFTFKGQVKGTGKGDISLWGRVIFLPVGNEEARNGAVLLMLASSAAPEIKTADDVGEKGELPILLKTFRLQQQ